MKASDVLSKKADNLRGRSSANQDHKEVWSADGFRNPRCRGNTEPSAVGGLLVQIEDSNATELG